eukprot:JP438621.1.p1 GENE.JP438621.1~~JP438621.1.p1  ORF type:complete len:68 (-),score=2.56 JP438621.1:149-352(-)
MKNVCGYIFLTVPMVAGVISCSCVTVHTLLLNSKFCFCFFIMLMFIFFVIFTTLCGFVNDFVIFFCA